MKIWAISYVSKENMFEGPNMSPTAFHTLKAAKKAVCEDEKNNANGKRPRITWISQGDDTVFGVSKEFMYHIRQVEIAVLLPD